MRNASYAFGCYWIAQNDETEDLNPETVSHYISTLLLADLFNVEPAKVAQDIIAIRTGTASGHLARALKTQRLRWSTSLYV